MVKRTGLQKGPAKSCVIVKDLQNTASLSRLATLIRQRVETDQLVVATTSSEGPGSRKGPLYSRTPASSLWFRHSVPVDFSLSCLPNPLRLANRAGPDNDVFIGDVCSQKLP